MLNYGIFPEISLSFLINSIKRELFDYNLVVLVFMFYRLCEIT
jgi:hypothetical protein